MKFENAIIAVDFDNTLCFSNWPELGEPNLPEIIELYGNNSRKITCDIYIDDRNIKPEELVGAS